jgi:transcriptional antiterminator
VGELLLIKRVFNNNSALVELGNNREAVVVGNGIAFKKTEGKEIDTSKVENIFYLENSATKRTIFSLLKNTPIDIAVTTMHVVNHAYKKYHYELFDYFYLSLSEHILGVYHRILDNTYQTSQIPDIKDEYPLENKIAQESVKIIERDLKIKLPVSERKNIMLHLINARIPEKKQVNREKNIINIEEMLHIVQVILDQHNIYRLASNNDEYERFMIHLQYLFRRLEQGEKFRSSDITKKVKDELISEYPESFVVVKEIDEQLKQDFQWEISDEEKLYLIVHIQRIYEKSSKY